MKCLIKVFDVVEGKVIAVAGVESLRGRTFKAAMQRAGVTTKGICKGRDVITYVSDEGLSHEQKVALANLMKDWQAEADTVEYGIECAVGDIRIFCIQFITVSVPGEIVVVYPVGKTVISHGEYAAVFAYDTCAYLCVWIL
jgi:hypothetical protein